MAAWSVFPLASRGCSPTPMTCMAEVGAPDRRLASRRTAPWSTPRPAASRTATASRHHPTGAAGVVAGGPQARLDSVEVNAVPQDLGEAVLRPVTSESRLGHAAQIAGSQAVDGATERQVGRGVCVPEHDVGPE